MPNDTLQVNLKLHDAQFSRSMAGVQNQVKKSRETISVMGTTLSGLGTQFGMLDGKIGQSVTMLSNFAGVIGGAGLVGVAVTSLVLMIGKLAKGMDELGEATKRAQKEHEDFVEKTIGKWEKSREDKANQGLLPVQIEARKTREAYADMWRTLEEHVAERERLAAELKRSMTEIGSAFSFGGEDRSRLKYLDERIEKMSVELRLAEAMLKPLERRAELEAAAAQTVPREGAGAAGAGAAGAGAGSQWASRRAAKLADDVGILLGLLDAGLVEMANEGEYANAIRDNMDKLVDDEMDYRRTKEQELQAFQIRSDAERMRLMRAAYDENDRRRLEAQQADAEFAMSTAVFIGEQIFTLTTNQHQSTEELWLNMAAAAGRYFGAYAMSQGAIDVLHGIATQNPAGVFSGAAQFGLGLVLSTGGLYAGAAAAGLAAGGGAFAGGGSDAEPIESTNAPTVVSGPGVEAVSSTVVNNYHFHSAVFGLNEDNTAREIGRLQTRAMQLGAA